MKTLALLCVVAGLLPCGTSLSAQTVMRPEPKLSAEVSGETLKDFAVKFSIGELDRGSPESCVQDYLDLAEGYANGPDGLWAIQDRVDAIVAKELEPTLAELWPGKKFDKPELSEKERRKRSAPARGRLIMTGVKRLSAEESTGPGTPFDGDDVVLKGDVQVAVTYPDGGDPDASVRNTPYAFLCRQDSDASTWRIVRVKRPIPRAPAEGRRGVVRPEARKWEDFDPGFGTLIAMPDKVSEASDEGAKTREAIVQAWFRDVIRRELQLRAHLLRRAYAAWLDAMRPLFDAGWLERLEQPGAPAEAPTAPEYEIAELRDDPSGVVVKLKDDVKSEWYFEAGEANGAWHIVAVSRRFLAKRASDGAEVETLKALTSPLDMVDTPIPSVQSLPLKLALH